MNGLLCSGCSLSPVRSSPCILTGTVISVRSMWSGDLMPDQPIRVVVEVATPEVVKMLQAENDVLRSKIQLLQDQHNALHATVYQLMEKFAAMQRREKG